MPLGNYKLGTQTVQASSVGLRLTNGTLAGSLEMLDQGVRNMVNIARRPLAEALQMASQTPADLLGLPNRGKLAPNYLADIIMLNQELKVSLTMVRGNNRLPADYSVTRTPRQKATYPSIFLAACLGEG